MPQVCVLDAVACDNAKLSEVVIDIGVLFCFFLFEYFSGLSIFQVGLLLLVNGIKISRHYALLRQGVLLDLKLF